MIPAALAWPAVALGAGVALWVNTRLKGFLPDDPPRGARKQHCRPVPLAGVVLVVVLLPWVALGAEPAAAAAFALAGAVGFVDDRGKETGRDLDWRWKGLGLLAAAALGATTVADPLQAPAAFAAVVVFLFVLTNATNFLDNMDGVACALAATSLLLLDFAPDSPWAAVGAGALGFLPWNWPRPRLFLGDAGAYALGLATGLACAAATRAAGAAALGGVAVQLVDFVQVVLARLWLGLPPWVGDRRHLTHLLQNAGVPRVAIAPLVALAALAAGALAR